MMRHNELPTPWAEKQLLALSPPHAATQGGEAGNDHASSPDPEDDEQVHGVPAGVRFKVHSVAGRLARGKCILRCVASYVERKNDRSVPTLAA